MSLLSGTIPLRNLTNSPLLSPRLHGKTHFSNSSNLPYGSDESGVLPSLNIDDGIWNAQRVTSDQNLPLGSARGHEHDNAQGANIHDTETRTLPGGNIAMARQYFTGCSTVETKACEHRRGWSLNDLDCIARIQPLFHDIVHQRSASSKDVLEATDSTTVYPHLPPGPPPCRRATPDGIPSFGTPEAQELRLVPPSRLHQFRRLVWRRLQQLNDANHVVESTSDAQNGIRRSVPAAGQHQYRSPTEMLRRASGMTRPTPVNDKSGKPRRSVLPRGVIVAAVPGNLAVAEDGSHVRGRFGHRASGHGVGQRTMDIHPLVRRQGTSAVEEEVQAINKACGRESLQEQHQSGSAPTESQPLRSPRCGPLQRLGRQNPDITEVSTAERTVHSSIYAFEALERQVQSNAELPGGLQESPGTLNSSFPRYHSFLSRLPRDATYQSSRADNGIGDIRSSGNETIRPPRMSEPPPCNISLPQSAAPGDSSDRQTMNDVPEGRERESTSTAAAQRRDWRMEIEIC